MYQNESAFEFNPEMANFEAESFESRASPKVKYLVKPS